MLPGAVDSLVLCGFCGVSGGFVFVLKSNIRFEVIYFFFKNDKGDVFFFCKILVFSFL